MNPSTSINETFKDNIPTSSASSSSFKKPNGDRTKNTLFCLVGGLTVTTVGLLAATIVLIGMNNNTTSNDQPIVAPSSTTKDTITSNESSSSSTTTIDLLLFANPSDNVCSGAKLALENKLCADLEVPSPQAGDS